MQLHTATPRGLLPARDEGDPLDGLAERLVPLPEGTPIPSPAELEGSTRGALKPPYWGVIETLERRELVADRIRKAGILAPEPSVPDGAPAVEDLTVEEVAARWPAHWTATRARVENRHRAEALVALVRAYHEPGAETFVAARSGLLEIAALGGDVLAAVRCAGEIAFVLRVPDEIARSVGRRLARLARSLACAVRAARNTGAAERDASPSARAGRPAVWVAAVRRAPRGRAPRRAARRRAATTCRDDGGGDQPGEPPAPPRGRVGGRGRPRRLEIHHLAHRVRAVAALSARGAGR